MGLSVASEEEARAHGDTCGGDPCGGDTRRGLGRDGGGVVLAFRVGRGVTLEHTRKGIKVALDVRDGGVVLRCVGAWQLLQACRAVRTAHNVEIARLGEAGDAIVPPGLRRVGGVTRPPGLDMPIGAEQNGRGLAGSGRGRLVWDFDDGRGCAKLTVRTAQRRQALSKEAKRCFEGKLRVGASLAAAQQNLLRPPRLNAGDEIEGVDLKFLRIVRTARRIAALEP